MARPKRKAHSPGDTATRRTLKSSEFALPEIGESKSISTKEERIVSVHFKECFNFTFLHDEKWILIFLLLI